MLSNPRKTLYRSHGALRYWRWDRVRIWRLSAGPACFPFAQAAHPKGATQRSRVARNPKVAKKTSSRKPRPAEGKGRVRRGRPKVCLFCAEHAVWVDYKDVNRLGRFLNNRGRIR